MSAQANLRERLIWVVLPRSVTSCLPFYVVLWVPTSNHVIQSWYAKLLLLNQTHLPGIALSTVYSRDARALIAMQSRALFPAPPFVTLRDAITAAVMWNPLKVHCSPLARIAIFTTAHIYRVF
jgi:hypothetical protein